MKKQIKQLKEFHTAFGLIERKRPSLIPDDEYESRRRLLEEEVLELDEAYYDDNIIEVADAITDCLYVLIGTALQFGLTDVLEKCFDEVHRSNMSKLGEDGMPIVHLGGKVMKGPNYSRPDLYKVLKINQP